MSIVLVNPAGRGSWQGESTAKTLQYMFPYSITFLHNYMLKKGIESRVFDLFEDDIGELIEYCANIDRPIVGVTAQSYSRYEAIDIIQEIKRISPKAICIVGGKHFSYCAEETLKFVKEIDIVVRGDGEITLHELIGNLFNNKDISSIRGITYRDDGRVITNQNRPPEKNIEEFSLDFQRVPMDSFKKGIFLRNFDYERIRSLPIHLSRGCTRKCVYCSYGLTPYRVRTIENVINEILYMKSRFNCDYFTMSDPSFCERNEFVEEFCTRLIRENANIKWYCEARVDTPLATLELMARAGCVSLDFAIESGSEKVLKAIRKGIDIPQAFAFAREAKNLGIRTLVFFMVSLPDETEQDAYETLRVAENMANTTKYIVLNVSQILPGTALERIARERGILPKHFSWYDRSFNHSHIDLAPSNLPIYLEHLSIDFIREFCGEFQALKDVSFTSTSDLVRMIRKGMRRIPHQSIHMTLHEMGRFGKIICNKLNS